jgi:stage II sporulation protein R
MAVSRTIPEESIRLRILANSDTPVDQWTKRQIKNVVVTQMNKWVDEPTSLEEAREIVNSRLPEIEQLIGKELQRLGFDYSYKAELAQVPFPTKMYGNRRYPAGEYEALRITLGQGNGQNWWCVLFPPLCFVDAVSGEKTASAVEASGNAVPVKAEADADAGNDVTSNAAAADGSEFTVSADNTPEVRFFLWDVLMSLVNFFKGLFA